MIKRIQHIKSFGVFLDFKWPTDLPDFKQFNLIYGWNYSGKTTLSRVFRCFEYKTPHPDFAVAEVQLTSVDGNIHNLLSSQSSPVIRVFNSDFVHDNLGFDSGSTTPILVLGAEDIAKQEAIKTKKTESETLVLSKNTNETKKKETEAAIEKALTNYARDVIKHPLSAVNYDKRRFEPKVTECKSNYEKYLLSDDVLAKHLAVHHSTDKKPSLSLEEVALSSVSQLIEKNAPLLAKIVTAHSPIARLKEDSTIEKWVKEGRPLHEGKSTCQFCGELLPSDLFTHLTDHFSADYENLMVELKSAVGEIQKAQKENVSLFHKSDFYAEFSEEFLAEKNRFDELLKVRNSALQTLTDALIEKQTQAFTEIECPLIDDPHEQITFALESIKKIISKHNSRTTKFDTQRREAFSELEKHYAAVFVRDQKYDEQLQQIEGLKTIITEEGKKIEELNAEIRNLEKDISEVSKGAERINELLLAYFGKNDLCIEVSAEKQFQIVRNGIIAKNLSEGEKTAIAFAYFITRVQDGQHLLTDTIVVIDDPISSLDANHLFNTYALIKTQLAECKQLFISTHSYEFYNLIREWVSDDEGGTKKPQAEWKKWSIYLIKRMNNGKSELTEIPKELLSFKSEYHFLFSTLYSFDKSDVADFDCLLNLPNIARRFMEAFGGIMIPLSVGLKKKMDRLFPDTVERERVWKFINHYSHNATVTRSLVISDISECKAIIRACLNAVKNWDSDYFNELETETIGYSS